MATKMKKLLLIALVLFLTGCIVFPATVMAADGKTSEKTGPEISQDTRELVDNLGGYDLTKQDQNQILEALKSRKQIEAMITKSEKELSQKSLKSNDRRKGVRLKEEFSLNPDDPNSQIPRGGIVQFSSDGVTRVFSSRGEQVLEIQDSDAQNVLTPSGNMMPVSHVFAVPEDVIVYNKGNRDYYIQDGKILFIKEFEDSDVTVSAAQQLFLAGSRSPAWVAYAESDPITDPVIHSSAWTVPYSPAGSTNILFTGVESSDGSSISQPVVAFNFPEHNHDRVRWANQWTGASWLCNGVTCDHSRPVIRVNQGDTINGRVIRIPLPGSMPDLWLITTSDATSRRSTSYMKFYDQKSPSRIVTAYEMQGDWLDQRKISDTVFTNIIARDASFNPIPLAMQAQYNIIDKPGLTGLYVDVSQSPSKITIFTNHAFTIITSTDGNGEIQPSGGTVDPSGMYPIKSNEEKIFDIIASPGYVIDDVLVDGQSQGPVSSYTFRLVTQEDMKDHSISATFRQNLPEIVPLCPAGTPFTESADDQEWSVHPMTFVCGKWDGDGQVFVSGDKSSLTDVYANDYFWVDTPNGYQFFSEDISTPRHPALEITSGLIPGQENTLTLTVGNWEYGTSYGSSTGTSVDQEPWIIQVNSPPVTTGMPMVMRGMAAFSAESTNPFITWGENGKMMLNGTPVVYPKDR
jgi:hypothetical protein